MAYDLPAYDDLRISTFSTNTPTVLHLDTIRSSIVYELLARSDDYPVHAIHDYSVCNPASSNVLGN